MFIGSNLGPDHFTIVTTIIIVVIRMSVVSVIFVVSFVAVVTRCSAAAAAVLPVRGESQDFWRQKGHTEHDQFEGFDKCVARRDLDQIRVGAHSKRRYHLGQLMLMSQHGDAPRRIPLLERLDLSQCRIEIIADIDDEQDGLLLRERAQDGIVNAGRRSEDAKTGRPVWLSCPAPFISISETPPRAPISCVFRIFAQRWSPSRTRRPHHAPATKLNESPLQSNDQSDYPFRYTVIRERTLVFCAWRAAGVPRWVRSRSPRCCKRALSVAHRSG